MEEIKNSIIQNLYFLNLNGLEWEKIEKMSRKSLVVEVCDLYNKGFSTKEIENVLKLSREKNFEIVSLIKPQFEAGKEQVGKNGVVREKEIHIEVINNVLEFCKSQNLYIKDLTFSPIKGPAGNIEYLVYLTNVETENEINIENIVNQAHEQSE